MAPLVPLKFLNQGGQRRILIIAEAAQRASLSSMHESKGSRAGKMAKVLDKQGVAVDGRRVEH